MLHNMATKHIRAHTPAPMSLAEHAYTEIKDRILSLQLRPGLFLNQQALSKMLGIGSMPVRQAVHRLMSEGLIEVIPRKGLVIRPDSLHDVLALIEARLAMEPNIAALAAERATKQQVATLKKMLMESKRIVDQSERKSFMALDRAFHSLIAESAGNKILADAQRPLHERSNVIWHLRIMPADGLVLTQHEHHDIFEAIAKRDASAARRAMEQHLRSLQKRILEGSISR
jgi:GntR family transcriptional regulator, rspAB operon transcriptional repressor